MTFDDVIGQEDIKQRLRQMVSDDRLPHAVMLCGPQGIGKLAVATAFACYLLADDGRSSSPNVLAMLRKLEHPDLHFTFPTIKLPSMGSDHKPVSDDFIVAWRELLTESPYITMDRWMQQMGGENQQAIITAGESDELVRKLSLKSSQGGRKVSVIWLPERMNTECANKLLKLIEEPPRQTVFLLVSERPDQLLETIRSRVQRIDVKRLPSADIEQALVSRRAINNEAATRIARIANGSWQKALDELQVGTESEQFLDMFISLMRQAYRRDIKALRKWSDEMATYGRERQKRWLTFFLRMVRENFIYNFRQQELNYMTEREEDFARNFARFINEANVITVTETADKALRDIAQNANAKIVFFDLALKMVVQLIQK